MTSVKYECNSQDQRDNCTKIRNIHNVDINDQWPLEWKRGSFVIILTYLNFQSNNYWEDGGPSPIFPAGDQTDYFEIIFFFRILYIVWTFWALLTSCSLTTLLDSFNTLRLRQNGGHFADYIFKCVFLNEHVWILIKISMKFVPKGPINNIPALVQIMAWRRPGDKPLSEPVMFSLPTHICVTRPQWVKWLCILVLLFSYRTILKSM